MSVWVQVHILSAQQIAYKGLGKFALTDKEGKLEYWHRTEMVFFKQAESRDGPKPNNQLKEKGT